MVYMIKIKVIICFLNDNAGFKPTRLLQLAIESLICNLPSLVCTDGLRVQSLVQPQTLIRDYSFPTAGSSRVVVN